MEEWKDVNIKGFENKYIVSNNGTVKIKNGKILNSTLDSKGYLKVSLWKNNKSTTAKVHRLVALAFIFNDDPLKNQVNHIDGNKLNNSIDNLEWVTCKENINHAYLNGLCKTGAERHNSKKIILKDIHGNIISQYSSLSTLSNIINIGSGKIVKTLNNNGIIIEFIDAFDINIPVDIILNSFNDSNNYCPIAIYDDSMNILVMYSTISTMSKMSNIPPHVLWGMNTLDIIRYKKRGKKYNNFYNIKKITFKDFFTLRCSLIDTHFKIK